VIHTFFNAGAQSAAVPTLGAPPPPLLVHAQQLCMIKHAPLKTSDLSNCKRPRSWVSSRCGTRHWQMARSAAGRLSVLCSQPFVNPYRLTFSRMAAMLSPRWVCFRMPLEPEENLVQSIDAVSLSRNCPILVSSGAYRLISRSPE